MVEATSLARPGVIRICMSVLLGYGGTERSKLWEPGNMMRTEEDAGTSTVFIE